MPGFANQNPGTYHLRTQEVDYAGTPVLVFNLCKGRPIMNSQPVDDGRVWTHVIDVLPNNEDACGIAAINSRSAWTMCLLPSWLTRVMSTAVMLPCV